MSDFDLIFIGAGPAGMSASATAAQHGLKVLMLDEQPRAGGLGRNTPLARGLWMRWIIPM